MASFRSTREIRQYEAMLQVAKLYYLENLSQQQIADQLGMSRSNVSRILINCREEGVVEIRIHEETLRTAEVKRQLQERFGLRDIVVAPRSHEGVSILETVGQLAADYVEDILEDNMTVGVGWGSSIHRFVHYLRPGSYHDLHVIQLIGGTSIRQTYKDGVQVALEFARKTEGFPHILNAPMLVSSQEVRNLFLEENSIRQHLELAQSIDAAVVTVSTNEPEESTMVAAGYLTKKQSWALCDDGLFTHILGQHIDVHGNLGDTPLNQRVVGIHLDTFRRIPLRIGVACGAHKIRQIAAAMAGGHINVLITDELTACQVEEFAERQGLAAKEV